MMGRILAGMLIICLIFGACAERREVGIGIADPKISIPNSKMDIPDAKMGIADFKKSVVKITSSPPIGQGEVGTGFIIRSNKGAIYIVTASHVVAGDPNPKIEFSGRPHNFVKAKIVGSEGYNQISGLALLRVDGENNIPNDVRALLLSPQSKIEGGETLTLIGHPARTGDWTVFKHNVANVRGREIILDQKIPPRFSGGPMILDGKVVGIVTSSTDLGRGLRAKSVQTYVEGFPEMASSLKAIRASPDSWKDPTTGMDFVWVEGGCYQMGCGAWTSDCDDDQKPVHEVCVDGFWMGKYEVTQGQWQTVMGRNPANFRKGSDYPVEQVYWNDTQDFIATLNRKSSQQYRLPSEAEWEFACRSGGKPEKYSGGGNIDRVAWYRKNSGDTTHPVGGKDSNGAGLYDMSGNVCELVQDWYDEDFYGDSTRSNPVNKTTADYHVLRGGHWASNSARCAGRGKIWPSFLMSALSLRRMVGFRLVRPAQD